MHPDEIWRSVQKRAAMAMKESFSPHNCRQTFCSDLLEAGVDIVTVQKLSRHADLNTLMLYDDNRRDLQGEISDLLSQLV